MNPSNNSQSSSRFFLLFRIVLFVAAIPVAIGAMLITLLAAIWKESEPLLIVIIPIVIALTYLLYCLLFHKGVAKFVKVFISIVLTIILSFIYIQLYYHYY
ncbi:hypothetical protein [Ignatzschineria sp. LJL83]